MDDGQGGPGTATHARGPEAGAPSSWKLPSGWPARTASGARGSPTSSAASASARASSTGTSTRRTRCSARSSRTWVGGSGSSRPPSSPSEPDPSGASRRGSSRRSTSSSGTRTSSRCSTTSRSRSGAERAGAGRCTSLDTDRHLSRRRWTRRRPRRPTPTYPARAISGVVTTSRATTSVARRRPRPRRSRRRSTSASVASLGAQTMTVAELRAEVGVTPELEASARQGRRVAQRLPDRSDVRRRSRVPGRPTRELLARYGFRSPERALGELPEGWRDDVRVDASARSCSGRRRIPTRGLRAARTVSATDVVARVLADPELRGPLLRVRRVQRLPDRAPGARRRARGGAARRRSGRRPRTCRRSATRGSSGSLQPTCRRHPTRASFVTTARALADLADDCVRHVLATQRE